MDSGGRKNNNNNKYYQSNNNYRGGGRGGGPGTGKGKYRDDLDGNQDSSNNNNNNNNSSNNNQNGKNSSKNNSNNQNDKDSNNNKEIDANLSIPAPKTKGGRGGASNNNNNNTTGNTTLKNNNSNTQGKNINNGNNNNKGSKHTSRSVTPRKDNNKTRDGEDTLMSRRARQREAAKNQKGGVQGRDQDSAINTPKKTSDRTRTSSRGGHHHGHHHHHKDPNAAAVEDAKGAFAFPSNPPSIDDISAGSQSHLGGPSVGRQPGGVPAPAVVTHASRILDPGNVFPRTPFIALGDITSGPILRNHISMMSTAVNNSFDKTTTASPKFAHYSALTLMEPEARNSSLIPSYQTQVYRSSNRFSGSLVCIRRIVSCPSITAERCNAVSEYLRQFRHPNLAQLNSVVHTTEFSLGSSDVLLEYRYVKGARSLLDIVTAREELTESSIWTIACQLLSLVRHFHESEVPLRGLHISKLLLAQDPGDGTPSNNGGAQRVIFTGLGVVDVLGTTDVPPMSSSIPQLLRADVAAVGTILSQLIHASLNIDYNKQGQVQASPMFTPALFALVRACKEGAPVIQLCRALGERLSMEMGSVMSHCDYIMNEYQKEIHNGRLMKLLMRLNFAYCANQPYQDYDTLFIVRLFYQYLFAQIDEHGNPQFDWGLVYHGLNKLDIGSEDLVQLVSESDHTLFVVSYKDVARCIDQLCDGMLTGGRDLTQQQQQQLALQQQAQQQQSLQQNNNIGGGIGGGNVVTGMYSNQNSTNMMTNGMSNNMMGNNQLQGNNAMNNNNNLQNQQNSNPLPPPPPPPPRSSGLNQQQPQQQQGVVGNIYGNNNGNIGGLGGNQQQPYGTQQQQYGGYNNNGMRGY